ncbi:phage tail tip lysozyme [Methylobacterium sp. A52T]
MDDWLKSFSVALGFQVDTGSLNTAKKSIADYEAAVRAAEKRIEDARWAGAKTEEEIAKLTRETNLKEAKEALANAQAIDKAEREAAQKREQRHKDFMSSMSKLALAATAMATAVSYAANRVAQSFDHLGFVSQRTGASVQALNSLSYAFKQVGGTSDQAISAVESFTKALRENSGVKGFVAGLGVDMAKDKTDQLLDTVRILQKHGYDAGSREAALAGISEENYALLTKYIDQIDRYRAEYNKLTTSLGVDTKQSTEASMGFQRSLTRLQATASALGDKLMVSLAPALKAIVDRFQEWIASNPEKVERVMNDISKALVWVAEKIGAMIESITGSDGDEFVKRWDDIVTRTERFAGAVERSVLAIERLLKMTGLLNREAVPGMGSLVTGYRDWVHRTFGNEAGTPGVVVTPGAKPGPVEDKRTWYERNAPTILGGKPDPNAPAGTRGGVYGRVRHALGARSAGAQPGDGVETPNQDGMVTVRGHRYRAGAGTNEGRARVASWLDFAQRDVDKGGLGLQPDKARAVVAGLQGESHADLRPWSIGDHRNGVPTAFGTAQWRLDRAEGLRRTAAEMGTSWNDIKAQQAWMRKEMVEGRYRGVYESIKGAANGEAALREYINRYENPADHAGAYAFRKPYLDTLRRQAGKVPVIPERAAQSAIQVTAPKIEVRGGGGASAAPVINVPGVPRMMQMPNFDVNALTRPDPSLSPAVQNSIQNSTTSKAISQTFNNNTTIHEARNVREAGRMMESTFGRMHNLALENAQSAVA